MVGFRLSLCQADPPTDPLTWNSNRIGTHTGVRFGLFGMPAARGALWEQVFSCRRPLVFLTGQDLRVSMAHFSRSIHIATNQRGAVAQLGARVNGIHEVAGSIPASSTKPHFV